MEEALRLQDQGKSQSCDEKATKFDLQCDQSYKSDTESFIDEKHSNTPTETDGNSSNTDKGTISNASPESLDDSGLSILSNSDLEEDSDTLIDDDNCKEQESTKTNGEEDNCKEQESTKTNGEEEGTYEELICLVRQFYVEKPINPAALAHQNIETC